ncbi:MAG TPA: hypothetical protein VHQ65_08660 [Thermoanaerobaculia bacterium]|nr:hypothetical protein [Thermoanaerobaculia bacterium]
MSTSPAPHLAARWLRPVLATALLGLWPTVSAAAVERASTRPADPERPVQLSAELDYASIVVEAYDGTEVLAEAEQTRPVADDPRPDGLRRVRRLNLSLHASGNRVVLLVPDADTGVEVRLRVPRRTDLDLTTSNGGNLVVRGVEGELALVTSNAAITLEGVAGTVLASTSNGAIRGTVARVAPGRPMSFVTSNGDVDLTLPADLAADLYVETDDQFLSGFDLAPLADPPRRSAPPNSRFVYAAVGGGGPQIRIRTDNGRVVLRSAAAR